MQWYGGVDGVPRICRMCEMKNYEMHDGSLSFFVFFLQRPRRLYLNFIMAAPNLFECQSPESATVISMAVAGYLLRWWLSPMMLHIIDVL